MVREPNPLWTKAYFNKIKGLEQGLRRPICGTPQKNGEPCQKKPITYGGQIVNGRCRQHGGEKPNRKYMRSIGYKTNMTFISCKVCAIQSSCDEEHKDYNSCPIEERFYKSLWERLEDEYHILGNPAAEFATEDLVRSFIRKERAWKFENTQSTLVYQQEQIGSYEDRLNKHIIKLFDTLKLLKKNAEGKSTNFQEMLSEARAVH